LNCNGYVSLEYALHVLIQCLSLSLKVILICTKATFRLLSNNFINGYISRISCY